MLKTLATAATVGALCWPVTSFASLDYAERAPLADSVERVQPKPRVTAVPAKSTSTYNGYYGPINGPTSRPTPMLLGLGGKW